MNELPAPKPQLWVEEIHLLAKAVSELPGESNIVEIGTAQGGGFHLIAEARVDPKNTAVHSYDPYPGDQVALLVETHENIFSHAMTSYEGSREWSEAGRGKINLLIVDGSHTLESVHQDYISWRMHLATPALILFHDYDPEERDGASHPGVRVFCDALRTHGSGSVSAVAREGRYLLVRVEDPFLVSLDDLKLSFRAWLMGAIHRLGAGIAAPGEKTEQVLRQLSFHSRLGDQDLQKERPVKGSDLAFVLYAASLTHALHEALLERTQDRAALLKHVEYLDMFLHARAWDASGLAVEEQNPLIRECYACTSISSLSRVCADLSLLICLVEGVFQKITK